MREHDFSIFLSNEPSISSSKAIATRIRHARNAERIIGIDLDIVVSDDDTAFEALEQLKNTDSKAHAPMQNAVRKYYKFRNGKEFPRMKKYHSSKHT